MTSTLDQKECWEVEDLRVDAEIAKARRQWFLKKRHPQGQAVLVKKKRDDSIDRFLR